jgi:hypothetical protein
MLLHLLPVINNAKQILKHLINKKLCSYAWKNKYNFNYDSLAHMDGIWHNGMGRTKGHFTLHDKTMNVILCWPSNLIQRLYLRNLRLNFVWSLAFNRHGGSYPLTNVISLSSWSFRLSAHWVILIISFSLFMRFWIIMYPNFVLDPPLCVLDI